MSHLDHSHLFTVRLWPDNGAGGGTGWRGRATHVLSGETRHFREWQALLDFLSAPREPPTREPRSEKPFA